MYIIHIGLHVFAKSSYFCRPGWSRVDKLWWAHIEGSRFDCRVSIGYLFIYSYITFSFYLMCLFLLCQHCCTFCSCYTLGSYQSLMRLIHMACYWVAGISVPDYHMISVFLIPFYLASPALLNYDFWFSPRLELMCYASLLAY